MRECDESRGTRCSERQSHYDAGRKLGLGSTQPEEISSNDPTTTSTAVNALHGTVQIWISKQWKSNLGVPAAESMT